METIKEQLEDMKKGNFSEEDINNSKELIVASINSITSEQDSEITYYYGQELSDTFTNLEEYVENIKKVSKEDILEIAKNISINTIYFLRN